MKEGKDYHQALIYNNKTQDWEESLSLGSFVYLKEELSLSLKHLLQPKRSNPGHPLYFHYLMHNVFLLCSL